MSMQIYRLNHNANAKGLNKEAITAECQNQLQSGAILTRTLRDANSKYGSANKVDAAIYLELK